MRVRSRGGILAYFEANLPVRQRRDLDHTEIIIIEITIH